MCKRSRRNLDLALAKMEPELLDQPWPGLNPGAMIYVLQITGEKMMLLKKSHASGDYNLYFDGSRMPQNFALSFSVRYWYFNKDGKLDGIFVKPKWPFVERHRPARLPESSSLDEALEGCRHVKQTLPPNTRPANHLELERCFVEHGIDNVVVVLITSWLPYTTISWYRHVKGQAYVTVHAYRNSQNEIQYAMLKNAGRKTVQVLVDPESKFAAFTDSSQLPSATAATAANASTAGVPYFDSARYLRDRNNRRSSLSVIENGLNLALRLGVITQSEFIEHSNLQSCFNAFLFCKVLNGCTIACMSYIDFETSLTVTVRSDRDFRAMFEHLFARAHRLVQVKKEALQPVLAKLASLGGRHVDVYTKFKAAHNELSAHASKARVLTYDSDDSVMHALKIPLANFLMERDGRKFTSLTMRPSRDNALIGLTYKNLSITNFGAILGLEDHTNLDGCHAQLWEGMKEWASMKRWADAPSESPALDGPPAYGENPEEHCSEFARSCWNCYQNFSHHLLQTFNLDLNTVKYISLPVISNLCFWSLYHRLSPNGFLVHPVEKSLAANDVRLREYCHGGFSYSADVELHAGQPLWPTLANAEPADSLMSLDLNASYGYAATQMKAPAGFGSTWVDGARLETSQRYRFFEFKAVFYTIHKWQTRSAKKLTACYHNFSSLGIFSIGKYPMDLVGVFEDGTFEIYQFDGAYCHGCKNKNCPDLPNYSDGRSRQELQERTAERDAQVHRWIGQDPRFSYQIIPDCCNYEYSPWALNRHFENVPELASLVTGYEAISKASGDITKPLPPGLTFLAIAEVSCLPGRPKDAPRPSSPSLRDEEDERRASAEGWPPQPQSRPAPENRETAAAAAYFDGPLFTGVNRMAWSGKVLLTRDYYTYLTDRYTVNIGPVEWAVFYKVDPVIPLVYAHLLEQRNVPANAVAKFYKQAINLSCGFFGSNPANNNVKTTRLTDTAPRNFSFEKYKISMIFDPFFRESLYPPEVTLDKNSNALVVVQTLRSAPGESEKKPGMQSLPLFASIVEYGKMRLNRVFDFYGRHIPRERLRLLYAHIDSTIIAVSTRTLEDAARDPQLFGYLWSGHYFCDPEKPPGYLHLQFSHNSIDRWKFVTPALCMWSVDTENPENPGDDRTPGVAKRKQPWWTLTQQGREKNREMFEHHSGLLKYGWASIPTRKRTDKLAGTHTSEQLLHFKKPRDSNT